MKKNSIVGLGLLIGLMLVISACSPTSTEVVETQEIESNVSQAEEQVEEDEMAIEPSVSVEDQAVEDGTVKVREVISAGPGWMVIHATAEGKPGPILGLTPVNEGANANVVVEIDLAKATDQMFAMLHVDQGEVGTFEFPEGDDKPAFVGETMVNVPFAAVLPKMEGDVTTLDLYESSFGSVLVDSMGMALYMFVPDAQGDSTCYDTCAENWPPLFGEGDITVGKGLDAGLVDTVAREDGALQVTYNGWPLYYFIRDAAAGDLNGQGVNDVWFLLDAAGEVVTDSVSLNY